MYGNSKFYADVVKSYDFIIKDYGKVKMILQNDSLYAILIY